MHCNGKCYLARQLKEEQKQEVPLTKKSKIDVQLFNLSEPVRLSNCTKDISIKHVPAYFVKLSSFHPAIFHPPTV